MSDEQWWIVIRRDTGGAYSVGTEIADPMPAEYQAVSLSAADAAALNSGRAIWDAARRSVAMRPEAEWPPAE